MPKTMDPILSIPSILGYWAIILGTFGGPGVTQFRSSPGRCSVLRGLLWQAFYQKHLSMSKQNGRSVPEAALSQVSNYPSTDTLDKDTSV